MKAINVLLALIVSAGIAMLVGEVGLRLLGFGPPAINTAPDAKLGWSKKPGSKIHRKTPEYDVTIRTDAAGLRDDFETADVAKPDGTFRVLFLGDSFVLGYTVDRADLFVDQLESAWKEEGRNVDVINAGTQGYSTDQSLVWLQQNGAKFAPDLIVHVPYENDIWWNASEVYLDAPKPMFGPDGELVASEVPLRSERSLFERTAIGNLLRKKPKMPLVPFPSGKNGPVELSSRLIATPEQTLVAEARTKMLFAKMAETARGMGAELAICPLPNREHVTGGEDQQGIDPARPYNLFVEAAGAAGAHVLEPIEALSAVAAGGGSPYYERDFHLDAEGNAVLAEVLYGDLDGFELMPARPKDTQPAALTLAGSGGSSGGGGIPRWPFFYAGLVAVLGTLYSRTYKDESVAKSFLQVGALLAVVFGTAMGVSALVESLPPQVGKLVFLALVFGILTFVLYKLGERIGTIAELLKAFTLRGHWYLMPLLSVLLTIGSLLVVAASSPLAAPFIYTLF